MSRRGRARTAPIDLAYNPAEKRDKIGRWTKDETRSWLDRHPVAASNVVAVWDQGTKGEHEAGMVWYDHAHKVALALSKRYGVSVEEAAGLLATYSPQTGWGQNVRDAAEALREHRPLGGPGEKVWWHKDPTTPNTVENREGIMAPGVSKTRAEQIMAGADPDVVFAGGVNKDGSLKPNALKIRAFYHLIATGVNDPSNPRVVIDRHAAGVARGVRMTEDDYSIAGPSTSVKKFSEYQRAFEEAARQISKKTGKTVSPEQVQAATWLTRQRLNGAMQSKVGRTRSNLGKQDAAKIEAYAAQYLPEAQTYLPKTGYTDLANPTRRERPQKKHTVPVPVDSDVTVRHIAEVLLASARFKRLHGDFNQELDAIAHLLAPHNIGTRAIRMALGLTHKEGGGRRGTAHLPNARLAEHGVSLNDQIKDVRAHEVYFRAAYIANAAHRLHRDMKAGLSPVEALRREAPHYKAHEVARKGRLNAVAQVTRAAELFGVPADHGTLVGWYINPLLNNEVECLTANGCNFYAEEGTVIGLPGSVHPRCGCYAGAPHEGAALVNDRLHNVVKLQRSAKPKFKLKGRAS